MYSQIRVLGKNLSNFPTCLRIAALFKSYIQRLLSMFEGEKKKRRVVRVQKVKGLEVSPPG